MERVLPGEGRDAEAALEAVEAGDEWEARVQALVRQASVSAHPVVSVSPIRPGYPAISYPVRSVGLEWSVPDGGRGAEASTV
jgi:hypothetical protein